jgi:hypothetical protein
MDAQLKAKWVEALRSGEYQQGLRALRKGNSFCCLGVLCDVMGAEWDKGEDDLNATLNGEKQDYYLAPEALAVVGMTDKEQEVLYGMNDNEGKTFPQIADYIEENL